MAPKNELTDEQKNDAEMKLLQGTCAICESVSLSAIKREKNLFRDADLILGYINQGDDMTAHPHSEHRVQIQLLNFGKEAAKLDRVQNKAECCELYCTGRLKEWSTLHSEQGRMNGGWADAALCP